MRIRMKKSAEELMNDSLDLGEVMLRPGVKFTFAGSLHTILEEAASNGKTEKLETREGLGKRALKSWRCAPTSELGAETPKKKRKKDFKVLPTNVIMNVHVS